MAKKHLIIGCGSAGLNALEKIRSLTQEDEVKIVTGEDHLPYSPTVLPYFLADRIKETDIWTKEEGYFQKMNASFARGKEVVQLLPEKKQVVYQDGTSDEYDTLLIASGSEPAKPPIKGLEEAGFLGVHTLDDCHEILRQLQGKKDVAVLGAGLIGMEVAIALCERGYKVKVIEKEKNVLPLYFDKETATYIEQIFRNAGIELFTGKEVTEVGKNKERVEIKLSDGSLLEADSLITATGVKARAAFLNGTGIKLNNGILVDERMGTNIADVYAAGDIAEAQGFFDHEFGISATIPNAVNQGKVAGANMAGEPTEYEGWISMNVFNFFGHRACSIGLSAMAEGDKEVLEQKDEKQKRVKKLIFQGNRLVGAMFLNVDVDPGVILYLVEKRLDIGQYKQMLFDRTRDVSLWLGLETERKEALPLTEAGGG